MYCLFTNSLRPKLLRYLIPVSPNTPHSYPSYHGHHHHPQASSEVITQDHLPITLQGTLPSLPTRPIKYLACRSYENLPGSSNDAFNTLSASTSGRYLPICTQTTWRHRHSSLCPWYLSQALAYMLCCRRLRGALGGLNGDLGRC